MYCTFKRKNLIITSICAAALILIPILCNFFVSDVIAVSNQKSSNWGLGFNEDGKQPIGNVDSVSLKPHDAYYIGDPKEKIIYLTFDAGYENGYTPKILSVLKKHNAKATFFVVGNYIKTSPNLIKQMIKEGHIVGNHTYNHPDMSKISSIESFTKEITKLEELYKETTGVNMSKFYRPPQGKYSETNLEHAKALGYKTVFWSLAYVDWLTDKQPTKEQAFAKLLPRIHPGAVVLLHSTSKTNSEILDELLTRWEKAGYNFKSLDTLCK